MELTTKTTAQLKQLALTAIQQQDRATLALLKAEALRRVDLRQAVGASTPELDKMADKLRCN